MRQILDPRDLGLAIVLLCWVRGWSRRDLARESGIDRGLIGDYVHGRVRPTRRTLSRIAGALRVEVAFLEDLIPPCRSLRLAIEAATLLGRAKPWVEDVAGEEWHASIVADALDAVKVHHLQLSQLHRATQPREQDRQWAESVWQKIASLSKVEQRVTVTVLLGDERSWALAERLCDASVVVADHDAELSLWLARLAAQIAEEAPGEESWRLCICGYCGLFVGNALQAAGRLAMAADAFADAERLWKQGKGDEELGLLDRRSRFDLKTSTLSQP